MSTSIIKTAKLAKVKIQKLIDEVGELKLSPPDPHLSKEVRREYEVRRRIIRAKIIRLAFYISTLAKKQTGIENYGSAEKEENKYGETINDNKDILN
ncbi:hypothetical protein X798_01250 [Onchocerca flexuosa]|uniref:30S ribosomal protein S17e n=1 Tax=Onchocerca flexuosa TaxID=387005 RepID=A0A238C1X2_9BILA|nr:hypothetical protein X798_01250 [Onchocerca flexuosa]